MKIGVLCVPFFVCKQHADRAVDALTSVRSSLVEHELQVHAIVNRCDDDTYLDQVKPLLDGVEHNDENILSRAWNRGVQKLLSDGCSYVLVINLDLILHPQLIEKLVLLAEMTPQAVMWSGYEVQDPAELTAPCEDTVHKDKAHFSCFLVNSGLFQHVGEFDEQFQPAYHEDEDMRYRMRLRNATYITLESARFYHPGQGTLKVILGEKMDELAMQIRLAMNHSMELYEAKWGGLPGNEKFNSPYDK